MLKEFKTLREEEQQRVEGRRRALLEKKARALEAEERQRRERERRDIVAWRRNRIEVATLSRMQVGATVFNPFLNVGLAVGRRASCSSTGATREIKEK